MLKQLINKLPFWRCHTYPLSTEIICRYFSLQQLSKESKWSNCNTQSPFFKAKEYFPKIALVDQNTNMTYGDLYCQSFRLSRKIADILQTKEIGIRVAFLCDNDASYVVIQWAIWWLKYMAMPLCTSHPVSEMEYFVNDAKSSLVIGTENHLNKLIALSNVAKVPFLQLDKSEYMPISESDELVESSGNWSFEMQQHYDNIVTENGVLDIGALIIYTSGTTGRPKGVMLSHRNLKCRIVSMVQYWGWTSHDIMLHCLPLHHLHGLVNALMTPLYCGATCIMLPNFDPQQVWEHILHQSNNVNQQVNMFTAVPTMYYKLIEYYNKVYRHSESQREAIKSVCTNHIRLMISGSAALPESVMSQWRDMTGHTLLERYGLTEAGVVLSNPIHGKRITGTVGSPITGIEAQVVTPIDGINSGFDVIAKGDSSHVSVTKGKEGEAGDLLVKGEGVFGGYWDNMTATKAAFTADGWFKTGDTASVTNDGVFKIVGRTSVDIIKSGGYKIGALEIERHLLTHPGIAECSVAGVADITWGQKVTAVLVVKNGHPKLDKEDVKTFLLDKIAGYKMPSLVKCVDEIPRNAMGKVNKNNLVARLFS